MTGRKKLILKEVNVSYFFDPTKTYLFGIYEIFESIRKS
jgi:hypothetical protein